MANPLISYIKESKEELFKVTWPSREQIVRDTLVVIGISVAIAAFFGIIDYGMVTGFERYFQI